MAKIAKCHPALVQKTESTVQQFQTQMKKWGGRTGTWVCMIAKDLLEPRHNTIWGVFSIKVCDLWKSSKQHIEIKPITRKFNKNIRFVDRNVDSILVRWGHAPVWVRMAIACLTSDPNALCYYFCFFVTVVRPRFFGHPQNYNLSWNVMGNRQKTLKPIRRL